MTIPDCEVPGGKSPKLTNPDEEAHKSSTVLNVDSLDRASEAQLTLEVAPQDAPKEACPPSDDGILAGGSPGVERVVAEGPLKVVVAPSFLTRLARAGPRRSYMPNRLLLSSYVPPQD